jgi:hypothetical protein
MRLLPLYLGAVADLAQKKDAGARFALANVSLKLDEAADTFEVCATDARRLVVVKGPCKGPLADYPEHAGVVNAPNGATAALIPAAYWKALFQRVGKAVPARVGGSMEVLRSVAVQPSERTTTFGAVGDDGQRMTDATPNGEGRYPPYHDILADARKSTDAEFDVDPKLFAEVLKTVAALACDDCNKRVTVRFSRKDRPVLVTARREEDGAEVEAIIMPLS